MNKVLTLIRKEWADVFRNRYVLYIVLLMPILMVVIPLVVLGLGANADMVSGMNSDIPPQLLETEPYASLEPNDAMLAFVGQQFNIFFLIIPLAIPMTIATYSIVGEKRDRSLEPLLAAPISTGQLLAGKALAAAGPGIAGAWLSGLIYMLALQVIVKSGAARAVILNPAFLISILVVAPLLTVLATTVGLMVSSRVNDPRSAEQLGMVVIVPVLGLLFAQVAGVITFDAGMALGMSAAIAVVDAVLLALAVRLFDRETILTRWK
ncbi:MAG: ABC transporter permease subunit [Anaerolineae bacterium]|nr:ABC transporter permease subunit [Anaerolineae bacterium]